MVINYRRGIIAFVSLLCISTTATSTDLHVSLLGGYQGGVGGSVSGTLTNFAAGFPLGLEFSVGYVRVDPGNAEKARKIFINDATDGTPDKAGWMWNTQLDFLYRVQLLGFTNAHVYAGVRHSSFTANFKFIGGNEDFDVTSSQWGIGAGVKALFPISRSLSFLVRTGLEHFFAATLYGHDTSYSPDGEYVNRRRDYTFNDADAVINQPKFQAVGMLGISYTF